MLTAFDWKHFAHKLRKNAIQGCECLFFETISVFVAYQKFSGLFRFYWLQNIFVVFQHTLIRLWIICIIVVATPVVGSSKADVGTAAHKKAALQK